MIAIVQKRALDWFHIDPDDEEVIREISSENYMGDLDVATVLDTQISDLEQFIAVTIVDGEEVIYDAEW